ncbi:MAG TPA: hypothetical protein VGO22_15025 [Pseudorhizobium sp.]|jgi:hypothetical protein|nr:hypothetical protein [Pseudorhizobium sp.]
MRKTRQRRHPRKLLVHGLITLALAGCATSAKQEGEGTSSEAESASSAAGARAKGGTTPSTGYVDPALVSAASVAESDSPADASLAQPQPGFADLVAQPTGIRAGSVSIFSGSVVTNVPPPTTATLPATAAPGRVNATAGSVFSAPAPAAMPATPSCGTIEGTPLNC